MVRARRREEGRALAEARDHRLQEVEFGEGVLASPAGRASGRSPPTDGRRARRRVCRADGAGIRGTPARARRAASSASCLRTSSARRKTCRRRRAAGCGVRRDGFGRPRRGQRPAPPSESRAAGSFVPCRGNCSGASQCRARSIRRQRSPGRDGSCGAPAPWATPDRRGPSRAARRDRRPLLPVDRDRDRLCRHLQSSSFMIGAPCKPRGRR